MSPTDDGRLSFVVIGAQKAGTTSLFRALSTAPDLVLPPSKELPFFSEEALFNKGIDWFLGANFPKRPGRRGTVTPQYLENPGVIERLERHNPELQVIAILRDPVDRALSHFRMNSRRGLDRRTPEAALTEAVQSDDFGYLAGSKYGELLQPWFDAFGTDAMRLLSYDDLTTKPECVAEELSSFLETSVPVEPLRKRANSSERAAWTSVLLRVIGSRFAKPLRRVIPYSARKTVWMRLESGVPSKRGRDTSPGLVDLPDPVRAAFGADLVGLAKLWSASGRGTRPSWLDR